MAADLISKKTRSEFAEHMVSWTVREIEQEFDAADVPAADITLNISGARRSQVYRHYGSIDFTKWRDVRKVLNVYETVLIRLEEDKKRLAGTEDWPARTLAALLRWLERDGFSYGGGHISRKVGVVGLSEVSEGVAHLDAPELQRQLDRLRIAVDDDPPLAIGTAKELVETVCKTILGERGLQFDERNTDIQGLVRLVREELGLLPENIPEATRGLKAMRSLLGNLGTIAQGLSEIRNLYGTGHGRAAGSRGLSSRHARLAVGAASTLAMFLLETHKERPMNPDD